MDDTICKEIKDIDTKLKTLDPHTQGAEYRQLLDIRKELKDQCNEHWYEKLDPNNLVKVGTTVLVVLGIMVFESAGHIFTSSAKSFIPKIL